MRTFFFARDPANVRAAGAFRRGAELAVSIRFAARHDAPAETLGDFHGLQHRSFRKNSSHHGVQFRYWAWHRFRDLFWEHSGSAAFRSRVVLGTLSNMHSCSAMNVLPSLLCTARGHRPPAAHSRTNQCPPANTTSPDVIQCTSLRALTSDNALQGILARTPRIVT